MTLDKVLPRARAFTTWMASILLVSFSPPLFADFKFDLVPALEAYEKGAYSQAVEYLSKLHPRSPTDQAELSYWKGLCYNRLQSFDTAIEEFKKAVKLKATNKDLYYELGQALYASQELDLAIKAFSQSAITGYKVTASTYYMAFSYQLKEDYKNAYRHYMNIIKESNDAEHLKQSAIMQIGEIKWALAEKIPEKHQYIDKLKNNVLPVFKKVVSYDAQTATAEDARNKMAQIETEISKKEHEVEYFANGSPMPNPYWIARARQDLKYDTNVVTRANDSILSVSGIGSFYSLTDAYGVYNWIINKYFVITPEIDTNYSYYANQNNPYVYQNDSSVTTLALKSRLEHTFYGKPAGFNFNLEYNIFMRDWQYAHHIRFYSRYYSATLSERLPLFRVGSTIISSTFKFFSSEDSNQTSFNPTISLTQNVQLNRSVGLTLTTSTDWNTANNPFYDRRDYTFMAACNFMKLFYNIDVSLIMNFTLVAMINQLADRGVEKNISPSILFSRTFNSGLFVNASYAYTDYISLDQLVYAYRKNVGGISLGYQF